MAEDSTDSTKILGKVAEDKVHVCVCSSSPVDSVQGFIHQIEEDMADVVESVRFEPLPYNIRDINAFDFHGIDVLLLCHSIENRRFSLTDVTDALYDGFLPRARNCLGKSKVGVVAHDLHEDALSPDTIGTTMNWLRNRQETTFNSSSLVLIGGQLGRIPVRLTQEQLQELRQFFRSASSPLPQEIAEVCLRRRNCMLCLPCVLCCIRCGCCRPSQSEGCFAYGNRKNALLGYQQT